jgi:hypothetical protein
VFFIIRVWRWSGLRCIFGFAADEDGRSALVLAAQARRTRPVIVEERDGMRQTGVRAGSNETRAAPAIPMGSTVIFALSGPAL